MGISELIGDEPYDERSRTFVIEGENHTLGRALQMIISSYPEVNFVGYTIPHPDKALINFRIQTSGPRALDVLTKGLKDLEDSCSFIIETYQESFASFKDSNNKISAEQMS